MSRGLTRAERLLEMERLYVDRGWSDAEMAARLGVHRSTAYRDRALLETQVPFVELRRGRWKIDRKRYLSQVRLNVHEALALYLAARRMSRHTRISQPHVASALQKLSRALRQPMTQRLVEAATAILEQSADPQRVRVSEVVAEAWVGQHRVRITYQSMRRAEPIEYVVDPYLIEPALWSDAAYVIAYSHHHARITTFKLERIHDAWPTGEPFSIPHDFDQDELLRHAWGIWYAADQPVTVSLRFAPGVAARRVQESIWHPSQSISDDADGGCVWTAQVAEWQEMLPWVRGWGAAVEVLEPAELRQAVAQNARLLGGIYGLD
jgi:CRISPR-associated endonuclease/helicase Cas3